VRGAKEAAIRQAVIACTVWKVTNAIHGAERSLISD